MQTRLNPIPEQICLDQHYTPQFYAELWGLSRDTIVRWFQDVPVVFLSTRELVYIIV
jgi:hypothetical protein